MTVPLNTSHGLSARRGCKPPVRLSTAAIRMIRDTLGHALCQHRQGKLFMGSIVCIPLPSPLFTVHKGNKLIRVIYSYIKNPFFFRVAE